MTNDGWNEWEADIRELEMAERFNMVIDDTHLKKQFDAVFNSHYYNELDMEADKRWQQLTGGKQ